VACMPLFSIHFLCRCRYIKNTRTDGTCLISILYLFIMKHSYVYILMCADKSYYTGVTANLQKRIFEHKTAKHPESYTAKRLPVELVFHTEFTDIFIAISNEKKIKKWSRAKKEALISGKFDDLPNLSKKIFKR